MCRPLLFLLTLIALGAGCSTTGRRELKLPENAALDAKTQKKIKSGLIEPGYTPEMVYLALGKPTEPASNIVDSTTNGTWIYRNFHAQDRDFVRAGFRRRVVFDPARRGDVVVTEPVDAKSLPQLTAHSVLVTFRDGRVVDIARAAEL